jgi:molybdate/tungstate transport system ATP-binding protein
VIVLEHISIRQGSFSLTDVSLNVDSGAYAVLMGRTGSGKSTLLETIIGFRRPAAGRVLLGGQDVTLWNPALRGVGYVPQDGALFSRMSVRDHLAFALRIRRVSSAEIKQRVEELASLLGIGHLLDRKPGRLSGGEQQRVALGRALSFRPRILCLDEPLSALDDETRRDMCRLLQEVRRQTGVTTLHVTHHEPEALTLASDLFRIEDGRIVSQSHTAMSQDQNAAPVSNAGPRT